MTKRADSKRRSRGTGTLYIHGKTYMAKWVVGGKTFKRSTETGDKAEARRRLDAFVEPFRAKSAVDRLQNEIARLRGAENAVAEMDARRRTIPIERIEPAFRVSARRGDCADDTYMIYAAQIEKFTAFMQREFPDVRAMHEITEFHAQKFLESIRAFSPNTYNKRITLFRAVWKAIGDDAGCTANPWAKMRKRNLDTLRRRALTDEEIKALFIVTEGELRALFAIGLYTGLRLGDAVQLKWENVDTKRGFIFLMPGKTKRSTAASVEIPILPELMDAIKSVKRVKGNPYVLPELCAVYQRNSATLHMRHIAPAFEAAGIETQTKPTAGVAARPLVGFHSLRHTFVTICALRGVPLNIVQSIVGHSSVKMTEYYAHTNREAAREALERAFSGARGA